MISIKTEDVDIIINDFTIEYKKYKIYKLVTKYLRLVPSEDLKGIKLINIYDDKPVHFPKHFAGGYYRGGLLSKYAEIDIFLNQTLRYMIQTSKKNLFSKLRNRFFLKLFGRLFVAHVLFHEIGHHKFCEKTEVLEKEEKTATDYADELIAKAHPFIYSNYYFFDRIHKYIFQKGIHRAEQQRSIIQNNPEYYEYMGLEFLKSKEFDKAIKQYDRLIEINQNYSNAYLYRGIAKSELGQYKEALSDFTFAISLNSNDSSAYYERGFCYHSLCDWENAIEDYSKAIELGYSHYEVLLSRSRCYEAVGENEKAKKDICEAVTRKGI